MPQINIEVSKRHIFSFNCTQSQKKLSGRNKIYLKLIDCERNRPYLKLTERANNEVGST